MIAPHITFSLDVDDVAAEARSFLRFLDAELADAIIQSSRNIAAHARDTHTFQNRTRDLERSIRALPLSGRASEGTLEGGVEAAMQYASYVEAWSEYLGVSFLLHRDEIDRRCHDAVENAVFRSSLR